MLHLIIIIQILKLFKLTCGYKLSKAKAQNSIDETEQIDSLRNQNLALEAEKEAFRKQLATAKSEVNPKACFKWLIFSISFMHHLIIIFSN